MSAIRKPKLVSEVYEPCSSARFIRNWFLSSSTRFRPCSMNSSKRVVNLAMRSRNSSKPKLMLGSESAIEGASADAKGARSVLLEADGSNMEDAIVISQLSIEVDVGFWLL